jgi:hypothetical protein
MLARCVMLAALAAGLLAAAPRERRCRFEQRIREAQQRIEQRYEQRRQLLERRLERAWDRVLRDVERRLERHGVHIHWKI